MAANEPRHESAFGTARSLYRRLESLTLYGIGGTMSVRRFAGLVALTLGLILFSPALFLADDPPCGPGYQPPPEGSGGGGTTCTARVCLACSEDQRCVRIVQAGSCS